MNGQLLDYLIMFIGNLNIQVQSTPEVTTQAPVIDIVSNLTEQNMETISFAGSALLDADSKVSFL